MGIIDSVTKFLGINIESRFKKLAAVVIIIFGIIIILSVIDPIVDGFYRQVVGDKNWGIGDNLGFPLSLDDLMKYFGTFIPQFTVLYDMIKQSTMFGVLFVFGVLSSLIAIIIGGDIKNPSLSDNPIARNAARLAQYFNDWRGKYE